MYARPNVRRQVAVDRSPDYSASWRMAAKSRGVRQQVRAALRSQYLLRLPAVLRHLLQGDGARDTGDIRCTNAAARRVAIDAITAMSSSVSSINGAGSYDEPYRFGRRPSVRAPFPFGERHFARLLIVRSRVQADPSGDDQATA
jgi:hypothetical protein